MTTFPVPLHEDTNGIRTSSSYGDRGDAVDDWHQWQRIADGGDVTVGEKADAAVVGGATAGSVIALLKGLQAQLPYADVETPVSASSGNVAAAVATASLAAVAAKRMYVTGFEITGAGATGASNIIATLINTLGGPVSFIIAVPAGVTTGIAPLLVRFPRPLKATADNTAITLSVPSAGAGNTHMCAVIHGFYR